MLFSAIIKFAQGKVSNWKLIISASGWFDIFDIDINDFQLIKLIWREFYASLSFHGAFVVDKMWKKYETNIIEKYKI